jgi:hypothetical protein
VVGEISARASDAGIIRPGGMQSLTGDRVKESFAAESQFVLRLPEQVVERLFGVFERAWAASIKRARSDGTSASAISRGLGSVARSRRYLAHA